MGPDSQPSGSWFKLGFPLGYICDVLQAIEALWRRARPAIRISIGRSTGSSASRIQWAAGQIATRIAARPR